MRQLIPVVTLLLLTAHLAAAYDWDASDPTAGPGTQAPWRAYAQWDAVDEISTREIHVHTTEPRYMTPWVAYVPEHPDVPSPRDFLGYIAGTEGKLTRPDDEHAYFRALAEASPNVRVETMGATEEGREMLLVIVSSEQNLVRLDEFKSYTRQLADPRNVDAVEAQRIVSQAKPIMHITAGLHSPETGPPEMVMELAYRLAVSNHPDLVDVRDNVVLLITPVTDVDGRARVVDWYYSYLQDYTTREFMPSISPPYWGAYAYHDNNRDGIQVTLKLTQNYLDAYNEWHPVYSLDLHESVPLLYVSGGTGPYNRNIDPITVREWQLAAHWELAELQRHNLPGVWTWGFYDGWNPSYLLWITNNRNSTGRFYETFGNSSARTMKRDLSEVEYAGKKVTSQQWYNADPPDDEVNWSLRNNTNYMQSGVIASLIFTARNGDMLLHNFWKKGKNSIETGQNDPPHAWIIPRDQRDPAALAYLLSQLDRHGVEIHRATADFKIDKNEYKSGDFIIRLDQPYGRLAKNLLSEELFPEDAEHRPYDDVSWTLGLHYGVETTPIEDDEILQVTTIERVARPFTFSAEAASGGDAAAYAIANRAQQSLISARYTLGKTKVLAAEQVFEIDEREYPAGTWLIPARNLNARDLQRLREEFMLDVQPLSAMPDVPTHELDPPRIALYHNWVSTQNDGWVRYTLEQAGVPFDYINDDDVKRGNLHRKYDLILVADQGRGNAKYMVHGRDPRFGAMPFETHKDAPSFGRIDSSKDITGGIGFDGVENLRAFLNKGGTLVLLGSAGVLATDFGLLRNVSSASATDTPGSFVQAKMTRPDHPLTYGYKEIDHVFRGNGPVYTVAKHYDHWIVAQYGTKPLRDDDEDEDEEGEEDEDADETETGEADSTGTEKDAESAESDNDASEGDDANKADKKKDKFLLGGYVKSKSDLEAKGAILDVPRHAGGRVILYSFNPLHRYLNHHDFNYVYNAILHWNDFPPGKPKEHPELALD